MAKLKAPLLSLGASQQLGKTLVFFNWKGIDVVREYVIPAYSRTTLQATQRDYVKDGVAMVHTAQAVAAGPLVSADQVAYSALASAKGRIITWFNQAVKLWVDVKLDGKTPIIYRGALTDSLDKDDFRMHVHISEETPSDLTVGKFYLGTTRTNLIQSTDATLTPGIQAYVAAADKFSGLSAGKKYYWQFRPTADPLCVGADSGIYFAYAT